MKKFFPFLAIVGVAIIIWAFFQRPQTRVPVTVTINGSQRAWSMDELIADADMIVVGSFTEIYPSRWSTLDGKLPSSATLDSIARQNLIIFTDYGFHVNQYLKGDIQEQILVIRTLGGQVGEDRVIVSGEPTYELGKVYLLFLFLESGPSADVAPGAYYAAGLPYEYEIVDGKAVSANDEWVLEDLITYIDN